MFCSHHSTPLIFGDFCFCFFFCLFFIVRLCYNHFHKEKPNKIVEAEKKRKLLLCWNEDSNPSRRATMWRQICCSFWASPFRLVILSRSLSLSYHNKHHTIWLWCGLVARGCVYVVYMRGSFWIWSATSVWCLCIIALPCIHSNSCAAGDDRCRRLNGDVNRTRSAFLPLSVLSVPSRYRLSVLFLCFPLSRLRERSPIAPHWWSSARRCIFIFFLSVFLSNGLRTIRMWRKN